LAALAAINSAEQVNAPTSAQSTAPSDAGDWQEVAAQDLSGRPYLGCGLEIPSERIGTFDTQLVDHFFQSMVNTSGMTLHIRQLSGKNSHHIVEATFKAFARALRMAAEADPRRLGQVASSKGVLTQEWPGEVTIWQQEKLSKPPSVSGCSELHAIFWSQPQEASSLRLRKVHKK
jgi:Imidazoleglycerol-phosphate dehydratase